MPGHVRLVIGGTNGGGNQWSVGLSQIGGQTASDAELSTWLSDIATDVANSYNSGGTGWGAVASSTTKLQTLRAYAYTTGSPPAAVVAEFVYGTAINGAGGATTPYTSAVVASLLTGLAGRSNRGRMYIPADGAALTLHQLTSTQVNTIANGVKALIDAINSSTILGGNPFVAIVGKSSTTPPVSQVRVDTLPDVQRRRADKVAAIATAVVSV